MSYINTDSESYGVFRLSGRRFDNSTIHYQANPIIDDIEADPDPDETYEPPPLKRVGDPSINDLAEWRWQNRSLSDDPQRERKLIRSIQAGQAWTAQGCRSGERYGDIQRAASRAFHELLSCFHHSVRAIANKYTPKGWYSPRSTDKHTNQQLFEDLIAVGRFGLYQAALAFDTSKHFRLWTFAKPKIVGLIANEANYQRRNGMGGGSRIDRWIFGNLGSTPEELLEAQKNLLRKPVFHSLQEAAEALRAANALEHSASFSVGGDGCDIEKGWALTEHGDDDSARSAIKPVEEWRHLYESHDPLYWSPQLTAHREVSAIVTRRSLARDLRERGLLGDDEGMVIS